MFARHAYGTRAKERCHALASARAAAPSGIAQREPPSTPLHRAMGSSDEDDDDNGNMAGMFNGSPRSDSDSDAGLDDEPPPVDAVRKGIRGTGAARAHARWRRRRRRVERAQVAPPAVVPHGDAAMRYREEEARLHTPCTCTRAIHEREVQVRMHMPPCAIEEQQRAVKPFESPVGHRQKVEASDASAAARGSSIDVQPDRLHRGSWPPPPPPPSPSPSPLLASAAACCRRRDRN